MRIFERLRTRVRVPMHEVDLDELERRGEAKRAEAVFYSALREREDAENPWGSIHDVAVGARMPARRRAGYRLEMAPPCSKVR